MEMVINEEIITGFLILWNFRIPGTLFDPQFFLFNMENRSLRRLLSDRPKTWKEIPTWKDGEVVSPYLHMLTAQKDLYYSSDSLIHGFNIVRLEPETSHLYNFAYSASKINTKVSS